MQTLKNGDVFKTEKSSKGVFIRFVRMIHNKLYSVCIIDQNGKLQKPNTNMNENCMEKRGIVLFNIVDVINNIKEKL